jgi:hypothetical protein
VITFLSDLVWCYSDMGSALTEDRRSREALPWLRKAREIIERLAVQHPTVAGFQRQLASNCIHFGRMPADAIPAPEALDNLRRAEQILAAMPKPTPGDRYNLACTRALIFPLIGRGQRELSAAQQSECKNYEALAMETLRQAIAEGYHDRENMNTDGDLEGLRTRDDFRELLRGLKTRPETPSR